MYRRPSRVLKRLARSRRGNVAIVFALALPMVVGGAAFGVESTYWYFKDLELQAAADASAYAGGIDLRQGLADSVVTDTATTEAIANGFDPSVGTIEVNTPPVSGPNQHPRAVEVILAQQQERFFTTFFSQAPVVARARSVAVFSTASNACILALHPSASRAAQFSGATSVNLNGCSVMANSVAADAVNVQGSAVLSTECLVAVGGVSMNSGVTMTECTAPVTQAPRVADPFADLVQPSTAGPCRPSNGAVLQPGIYCNGLSLSGNVTLNPGVYVINGSNFRINANAFVQGSGVTFFLTGGSRVQFNGNARIEFSAPTTGPYAGVLFFGDPDNTGGSRNTFNGTPNSVMTGALYFPSQAVEYLGNFSGQNGCTQVVGLTVEWTGSTTVGIDCTAFGMRPIPAMQLVRIAE